MKTNEAKPFRLPGGCRIALGATLGTLLAGACGGVLERIPSTGSESHFLAYCDQGCGPGLDCIGGICTRPCLTGQAGCSDLAANAACTNQSVEPGQVAVCDLSCAGGGSCAALGADYACDEGYCRQERSHGSTGSSDAGSDAAGRGVGGSSAGTGGGGSGTERCDSFRDQSPPPDVREISFTNTGSVPLYIQPEQSFPGCPDRYPLYALRRDGQNVDVSGFLFCERSCEQAIDEGWPDLATEEILCNKRCPGPTAVLVQPGQTVRQPVGLEVLPKRLPRACAQGATDSLHGDNLCNSRAIPQPGNYELIVYASRELQCSSATDCDCRPDANGICTNPFVSVLFSDYRDLKFTFQTGNYFQSQTFELSAP